jgi:hypothetical protein
MRSVIVILGIFLLLAAAGCNDDDCDDGLTTPPADQPTMANIWPHADGNDWVYDLEFNVHAAQEAVDPVPPLPTMAELHTALGQPIATEQISSDPGLYRLTFEGNVTTDTGVTGQNLVERVYDVVWEERKSASPAGDDDFLRTLARSRPDLRPAIAERLGLPAESLDKSLDEAGHLFFLGAYAFAAEDSGYFGYGDLNTQHAWVYLEGDLEVGSTFSLQLVPDLTDDVWLYGEIWSVGDREVGGVQYANVVECMYLVDMGIANVTDAYGNPEGEFRSYMYGVTLFVPELGPVACQERRIVAPDEVVAPGEGGIFEFLCEIVR